ncbi:hypothetical protein [Polystyrenella longa]|uniref:hypothetical protein n=1 Tax=Polystyrenella longa TaxID=2528007 RepID=UPI0011A8D357|nr:hypothetical protein [Polystyrenella longa]
MSVVISKSTGARSEDPLSHSTSDLVFEINDYWLLNWSVSDNSADICNPETQYLGWNKRGDYNIEGETRNQYAEVENHTKGIGIPGFALTFGKEVGILKQGHKKHYAHHAASKGSIISRTRKYVFCWQPAPVIYTIPDMEPVVKIHQSEAFEKFKERFLWRSNNVSEILTDDLKYLIVVPRNGVSEVNDRGYKDSKAFCYDINSDKYFTFMINQPGDYRIEDAGLIRGELHWLAYKFKNTAIGHEGYTYNIYNSESQLVDKFSLSSDYLDNLYWQPEEQLIWFVKNVTMDLMEGIGVVEAVTVVKFSIRDGSTEEISLPVPDKLLVPTQ